MLKPIDFKDFFKIHIAIWMALWILYLSFDFARQETSGADVFIELALRAMIWIAMGALLSLWFSPFFLHRYFSELHAYWRIPLVIFSVLSTSALWLILFNELDGLIGLEAGYQPTWNWDFDQFTFEMTDRISCLFIWHLTFYIINHQRRIKSIEENALRKQQQATQARIDLLRSQLNPHFLFNSLNSIIALIDENPVAAQNTLVNLSVLLRDALSTQRRKFTSLKQELEMIRRYVDIEKERFKEKLLFEQKVDRRTEDLDIPPYLIQPLVENAIKHGMRTSSMPLRVKLAIDLSDSRLVITVSNTGILGAKNDRRTFGEAQGIGLENLNERLQLELPGRHSFSLTQIDDEVVAELVFDHIQVLSSVGVSDGK